MSRKFMSLLFVSFAVVAVLAAGPALGNTLTYNFDGSDSPGTWAAISPYVGDANQAYAVTTPAASGLGWATQSGTSYVFGMPFSGRYSTHATMTFASPAFNLDGSGDMTFWLNMDTGAFTGVMAVPTAFSSLPATSTSGGFVGMVLLDITTGNIVLAGSADGTLDYRSSTAGSWNPAKTSGFGRLGGNFWELRFSQTQLAGLSQSDTYRLCALDSSSTGFQVLDTVSIPGTLVPEPGTLALLACGLAGLLCYAWRKRG